MGYDSKKPFTKDVVRMIKSTWETDYVSVRDFVEYKKFDPKYGDVHHTDSIGTKGVYHWERGTFGNAVVDAFAMNINDLLMFRATPYSLTDQIYLPKENDDVVRGIVRDLVDVCQSYDMAIAGGETSIHDDMRGMDISITMNGFVKEEHPKPNKLKPGNVLVGIGGKGIHSNGFTIVRDLFEYDDSYSDRNELTNPTPIYYNQISELNEEYDISGMMHITGGAFTKLKQISKKCDVSIHKNHDLKPQEIFHEIYGREYLGDSVISDEYMYSNFNSGIGFILGTDEKSAEEIVKKVRGFNADIIGEVVPGGRKIKIESMFSDKIVQL